MLKRFSRRVMRSFAVVCLTLAVVCLLGANFANSAVFAQTQVLTVAGNAPGNLSQVCVYVYATGAFPCYPAFFGTYSLNFALPFGAYFAFVLYDHNQGRFVELVLVNDARL
jgi:hypothetical protein